jgi:hypothetical protein
MAFRVRQENLAAALAAVPGTTAHRRRRGLHQGCLDSECCSQHPGFHGEEGPAHVLEFPAGMSNRQGRRLLLAAGVPLKP